MSFAERNRTLPCNIFFYRDGVSEGEYDKIKAEEGIAIDGMRVFYMCTSKLLSFLAMTSRVRGLSGECVAQIRRETSPKAACHLLGGWKAVNSTILIHFLHNTYLCFWSLIGIISAFSPASALPLGTYSICDPPHAGVSLTVNITS